MLTENGIEGTVDHLHRTIYGALLAGKTFQWMKKGPSKNMVRLGYRADHTRFVDKGLGTKMMALGCLSMAKS